MEEETLIVKEDKPEVDLVLPEVVVEDKPLVDLVLPEVVRTPYRDEYTITWVDGNQYDVVINESGICWTKKENISNE